MVFVTWIRLIRYGLKDNEQENQEFKKYKASSDQGSRNSSKRVQDSRNTRFQAFKVQEFKDKGNMF